MPNKNIPVISGAPAWFGRHPFPPEELRPCVARRQDALPRLYGTGANKVPTCVYVSTQKITSSEFQVPPGMHFEPYDIHGGDEVYCVASGVATIFEPDTGRTHRVPAGGVCYIPREVWHQTYNFEDDQLSVITFFAEKMWHETMGTEVEYPGAPKHLLPDLDRLDLPTGQPPDTSVAGPLTGRIGSYPIDGETARSRRQALVITPDMALNFIHGMANRTLVSLLVSNEIITTGEMIIPVGRESDQERHRGDEVMVVVRGQVSVVVPDETVTEKTVSVSRFEPREGERMLIPGGFAHRYYNSGQVTAKVLFSVAPGI